MFKELFKPFQYKKIPLDLKSNHNKINHTPTNNRPRANNWLGTLKRIWKVLAYKKGLLTTVFFLVVFSSALGLLGPFLVGMGIDHYLVTNHSTGLLKLLMALVFVYLLHATSIWLHNFWMVGIAQHTVYRLRSDLFEHLHQLSIPYFDKRQHGELMSRITNDIENVSNTLNNSVIQIFSSVLTLIGMVSVMLWLSPLLTMITLTIVPLMFLGMRWITRRTSQLFKMQQKRLGDLNGFVEETITGQRIVKTFSQEKKVISTFLDKGNHLRTAGFWAQTISGFIPKLMNVLNNVSFTIIAGVGGIFAYYEMITIGVIVIFAEYARQFTRPLNDLANQFNTLLTAVAGAERVFEVIDEEEEERDEHSAIELSEVTGEVAFRNVSFSYEIDKPILKNVGFHVSPGETVAFVGPTGAGKTTIIHLLSRFYDVNQGDITLDGHDIRNIKRRSLRRFMGFVLQDSYLFEGTVRENIRYGRLEASDEEIEQAAKLANAHSFITKLPNQYDTVLKQDGSGISQGQKQLLSIARAILSDPSILILDEATSSIDTVTEVKIQEALQRLMKGRTSFVIAHRLNTIQSADQILVIDDGQVMEKGSHESLLKQKGFYYELYHSQLAKAE